MFFDVLCWNLSSFLCFGGPYFFFQWFHCFLGNRSSFLRVPSSVCFAIFLLIRTFLPFGFVPCSFPHFSLGISALLLFPLPLFFLKPFSLVFFSSCSVLLPGYFCSSAASSSSSSSSHHSRQQAAHTNLFLPTYTQQHTISLTPTCLHQLTHTVLAHELAHIKSLTPA